MLDFIRPVPQFPGYYVDRLGNVYSSMRRNGRKRTIPDSAPLTVLAPCKWDSGKGDAVYLTVNLHLNGQQFTRAIHVIVLLSFSGPKPAGLIGCHENGISTDNRLSNLRWGTRESNEKDKERHGTKMFGESHHGSKLLVVQILEIRNSYETYKSLAKRFGVCKTTIGNIKRREVWRHVD